MPGTQVAVFYPAYGVSEMQRLQMATHRAKNVAVFAIDGNFDDTQTAVKRMFADSSLQKEASANGAFLSSANSINVGRLIPQIVYYIYAYLRLVSQGRITLGDAVDIAVPTGNFGNILAAWLAGRMGIPVKTLICASNRNNILTDFFRTGVYDTRRPFYKTGSPSMDILVSSNLERLLFYLYGEDDGACADLMRQLSETGCYRLSPQALQRAQEMFFAPAPTTSRQLPASERCGRAWATASTRTPPWRCAPSPNAPTRALRLWPPRRRLTNFPPPCSVGSGKRPRKTNLKIWSVWPGFCTSSRPRDFGSFGSCRFALTRFFQRSVCRISCAGSSKIK